MINIYYTPWGNTKNKPEIIADGIEYYRTEKHGGIRLSLDRQREFRERFPLFQPLLSGWTWFEQSLDMVAIVLAFSEFFKTETFINAFSVAKQHNYFIPIRQSLFWKEINLEN